MSRGQPVSVSLARMYRPGVGLAAGATLLALAAPAAAHPMPFSTLDLHVSTGRLEAVLTAHVFDLAHELKVSPPDTLLDPTEAERRAAILVRLLAPRIVVEADGHLLAPQWLPPEVLPDRQSWRLPLRFLTAGAPAVIAVQAELFPYDGNHQTFVNVYEKGRLVTQAIIGRAQPRLEHFAGSGAGHFAVARRFGAAGVQHILVGADHVLFLVGLLLLGGRLRQLVVLVSAFTIGHSVTLSLAALDIASPPARYIEPIIALSIVFVGADNLLARRGDRDLRPLIALVFGLVHGFGFAGVLRETGLPSHGLGWALFSFNVGVEVGQLLVVLVVATGLAALRSRSERAGDKVALAGSVVVAVAGAFWFIERVFFSGGTS
jgi:hydrogenase/urease accessory protein HupE